MLHSKDPDGPTRTIESDALEMLTLKQDASPEEIDTFLNALAQDPIDCLKIGGLCLSCNDDLSPAHLKILSRIVKQATHLADLDLSYCNLNEIHTPTLKNLIFESIQNHPGLLSLNLSSNEDLALEILLDLTTIGLEDRLLALNLNYIKALTNDIAKIYLSNLQKPQARLIAFNTTGSPAGGGNTLCSPIGTQIIKQLVKNGRALLDSPMLPHIQIPPAVVQFLKEFQSTIKPQSLATALQVYPLITISELQQTRVQNNAGPSTPLLFQAASALHTSAQAATAPSPSEQAAAPLSASKTSETGSSDTESIEAPSRKRQVLLNPTP